MLVLNIEPDSAHDPELKGPQFLNGLALAGLSSIQIILEVTSQSAVSDFSAFRRTLEQFSALGFRVAMDVVGSGYVGLRTIAEIAPDCIKAGIHLVRGLHASTIRCKPIDTMRRFAQSTRITLVGARCAQGSLLARPGSLSRLVPGP